MPTYEYVCSSCRRHTEAVQRFSDPPLTECPHCGGSLKRVFHPVGIVLKGSGFYSTDNRGGKSTVLPGGKESGDSGSSSGDSSSGSSSGSSSSESGSPKKESTSESSPSTSSSSSSSDSKKSETKKSESKPAAPKKDAS